MKELIEPGRDGLVLPTGELDALTEAIEAAYRARRSVAEPAARDSAGVGR